MVVVDKMGNVWRWIWLVHNVTLVVPHSVLYVLAYLGWLLLVLPLRVLHPPLYWTLEGHLYNLVLAVVGGYVHQAGIPGKSLQLSVYSRSINTA